MNKEFIVWGIPKGLKCEEILVSQKAKLRTYNDALMAIRFLKKNYDCTKCRVQVIDFNEKCEWDVKSFLNV